MEYNNFNMTNALDMQSVCITLPPGFIADKPHPLIIALHWGIDIYRSIHRDFMTGFVEPAFNGLGAILAAPRRTGSDWANAANDTALLNLAEKLQSQYSVNPGQILLTGYSMGGIGSWMLGSRHQESFAGILPISAQPPAQAIGIPWKIPLYVIHSQQDEFFPFHEVQVVIDNLQRLGVDITWRPLAFGTHFDTGSFITAVRASHPWIRSLWE